MPFFHSNSVALFFGCFLLMLSTSLPLSTTSVPPSVYTNSLNAISVLAALNVFFKHFVSHFSPSWADFLFVQMVSAIPNVPMFFGISGFLLYQSWVSNKAKGKGVSNFLVTKFLSVLPAVWFSFFVSMVMLVWLGVLGKDEMLSLSFFSWVLTQLSFFQVYNPSFLRGYGVGVLNGSLWTISVIFQYYLLFVVLAKLLAFFEVKGKSGIFITFLLLFSLVCSLLMTNLVGSASIFDKILTVSIFNHLFFFALGMTVSYYFQYLVKFVSYKSMFLLFFSLVLIFFISLVNNFSPFMNDSISLLKSIVIALFLFVFAYVFPNFLSSTKKYNMSYGVFMWHMIFMNFFLEYYPEVNPVYMYTFCTILVFLFSYLQLSFIENDFYNYIYKKYFSNTEGSYTDIAAKFKSGVDV